MQPSSAAARWNHTGPIPPDLLHNHPLSQHAFVQREPPLSHLWHAATYTHQVTLKENASPDELQKAKEKAKSDGGEIKHEFTLIKGFTSVPAATCYGKLADMHHKSRIS